MINIKFVVLVLLACICWYPNKSSAQSSPADNFAIYNWDESREAWELLYTGYEEVYASEVVGDGDHVVDPVPYSDGSGGGGDVVVIQKNRRSNPVAMTVEEEEPKDFKPMVVTGKKPSDMEGGLLSVIWRVTGLDGLFGQRSASIKSVPAPRRNNIDQVKCGDPSALREASATKVGPYYGLQPKASQAGRKLRIKWHTGTEETYINFGPSGGSLWMRIVLGTCKDAS